MNTVSPGVGDITMESLVSKDHSDHNGHLNMGYYLVLFDQATGVLFENLGVGWVANEEFGETVFTLETHVTYHRELALGEAFFIETRVAGFDHNKIQYLHLMFKTETRELAATNECIVLNVDIATRQASEFRDYSVSRLAKIKEKQAQLPLPDGLIGRAIKQL